MGLIKAILGAAGGTLADQWKEFFYCEALPDDVLMRKGEKQITGRSSNTKGNDNIISNGSGIAVADGQCMIIVEQGKIVEVCAEPGQFTWNASTEPSIFTGGLGKGILNTFKTIGKRFAYGGDTGKDQRVYYFNTKHILNNLFGTPTPIPFRIVDSKIGLDLDAEVKCSGNYVFRIADPLLFYTNIASNVHDEYRKDQIASTLKGEFVDALQPAFFEISAMEIRPNELPGKKQILKDALNKALEDNWGRLKGFEIVEVNITSLSIPKEYQDIIKEKQARASDIAMMSNPNAAAAALAGGQISAMNAAANNTAGAATGFMGMGMGMGMGGMNAASLFAVGAQQQAQQPQQPAAQTPPPAPAASADTWTCSCGAVNTKKFCQECGSPKPAPAPAADGWTCTKCGAVNQGKFCQECGASKPAGAPLYRCDKCGWTPEDPKNPPKFCPECGDVFDDKDIQ
ncbi:MAG: SPFH domain-containing protein [Ruminococcus sp.]|nr:SPFH domain-containing protein [Ruminococcus sp.]